MPAFRFVHAADLHLDTPFEGIGRVSPLLRQRLRDATLEAFDNLVDLCLESEAAFLVLAGDVYDGPERGVRARLRLLKGLKTLDAAGIEVFLAAGNHDPLSARGWRAAGELPGNVRLFRDRPESFPVLRGGQPIARVHGISYARREVTENLAAGFSRHPDALFQIGVLHATVGAHEGHKTYAPAPMETLVASGLDYWALGHVHTRALLRPRSPAVAYPGNPQALSPRETGARGALLVEVEEDGTVRTLFRPLDRVRFARIEADVTGLESLSELQNLLAARAASAREEAEGRDLLLTAALTGRGLLHAALAVEKDREGLLETLRDAEEGADPPVWWNGLDDRTAPPLDWDDLRGQKGFPAALLEEADRLAADPSALDALLREAWKGASFRPFPLPEGEDLRRLLEAARNLAAERLLGEGEP